MEHLMHACHCIVWAASAAAASVMAVSSTTSVPDATNQTSNLFRVSEWCVRPREIWTAKVSPPQETGRTGYLTSPVQGMFRKTVPDGKVLEIKESFPCGLALRVRKAGHGGSSNRKKG
ncbi:hypothetical protein A6R68_21389, partial [Neotoma lepida]